ncbi:MAG: hypothetical protein ACI9JE_001203, partial [Candidatus Krumholzibacteriia bacterium]
AQKQRRQIVSALVCLGLTLVAVAPNVSAQNVEFQPLMYARQTTALLEHDGLVIGGIAGGGLAFWDADDPTQVERLEAGTDLSGNDVTDLSWSGQHVWVATRGGGLTRIADVAGARTYRQYVSNLGSLEVNAVVGGILGSSERVFYGMNGEGVGQITDGLSGAIYTAEEDGLISNTVTSLAFFNGELFVASAVGVSRFRNNFFNDMNTGLTSLEVNDLNLDSDGNLLAATAVGVFVWNDGGETWSRLGNVSSPAFEISSAGGLTYARGGVLRVFNGASWQTLSVPAGVTGAIYAGDDFWLGGQAGNSSGSEFTERNAYVARLNGTSTFESFELRASQILNASGVCFVGGNPYVGAQIWQAVISGKGTDWTHYRYLSDTPENANKRLSEGIILSMASGPNDLLWAGLYAGTGLARIEVLTGQVDLINPTNSGLLGRQIINVVVHPDGPVITMHDQENAEKVEILVDPDDWSDAGNWLTLPLDGGLGNGEDVWDAVVQRRDVIWFAVAGVGVVRWDINGDAAGPNDPLTWLDQTDDRWDAPVTSVNGSPFDLTTAFGLEVDVDGSLWVGGNGLVQFEYDEFSRTATHVRSIGEKVNSSFAGLVSGSVSDVVRDFNGDIWAATTSGINRVRVSDGEVEIDSYIDLANYFANSNFPVLYSPNVIVGLPGTTYKRMAVSADRRKVVVSADQGAGMITVSGAGSSAAPTVAESFVYPNPFHSDGQELLKLGGLASGALAHIEVYNLNGQLVYVDEEVTAETGFWSGNNRVGNAVTTGMYVVRVTSGGQSQTLSLAIVR